MTISLTCAAPLDSIRILYGVSNGYIEAAEVDMTVRITDSDGSVIGNTRPRGLGKLFSRQLTNTEESQFVFTPDQGWLESISYQSTNHKGNTHWVVEPQGQAQADRFSIQIVIAIALANGEQSGAIDYLNPRQVARTFDWEVIGEEQLTLNGTSYQAKKVKRTRDNRVIYSWHSAASNWLPVQFEFYKDGSLLARAKAEVIEPLSQ